MKEKQSIMEIHGGVPSWLDVDQWVQDVSSWGIKRWVLHAPHYRGHGFRRARAEAKRHHNYSDMKSTLFAESAGEGFVPFINHDEVDWQMEQVQRAYKACCHAGLEFGYAFPFPLFPVQKKDVVQQVLPDLFDANGR